jgi:glutathione synthase
MDMSLAVAIQMDPIEAIDIDADSTFVLALEAQSRGYALYHYLASDLTLRHGRVYAKARRLTVRSVAGNHATLASPESLDLATVDVILMRQDPPFDMAYITATHLLEHIHPSTLVVNDPVSVRNAPEKLLATHFADLMPQTLITTDREEIIAFRKEIGDIIIKPLYGNGGVGVFHLRPDDDNLNVILELFSEFYREPIIIQQYLADVREGDRRIILIDGKPVGAINRIPAEGESRSNMHAGGTPTSWHITPREHEICDALAPVLIERGLIFTGIDVIGDYLTEINVTSPTGLQEVNRFDGVSLEVQIWNAIEQRLNQNRGARNTN